MDGGLAPEVLQQVRPEMSELPLQEHSFRWYTVPAVGPMDQ